MPRLVFANFEEFVYSIFLRNRKLRTYGYCRQKLSTPSNGGEGKFLLLALLGDNYSFLQYNLKKLTLYLSYFSFYLFSHNFITKGK